MTDTRAASSLPPRTRANLTNLLPVGAALVIFSFLFFARGMASEPVFVDETAYVTQSYFWDLISSGRRDDWAWLEYHAYDLPPLPKYLFGIAIKAAGYRSPDRLAAGAWFQNTTRPLVPESMIRAARWPTMLLAAFGCLALFALGTFAAGWRIGLLAALLLAINPLYVLLARRAMADVPAETFLLAAEATALLGWRRTLDGASAWTTSALRWSAVGILVGLAVASKLTGLLAAFVIVAWILLALALVQFPIVRRMRLVLGGLLAAVCALTTFMALNPLVTARPKGNPPPAFMAPLPRVQSRADRLKAIVDHRVQVSQRAQATFPHNALVTLPEKLAAVAIQGFGRFGAFGPRDHDSTIPYPRFSLERDWGVLLWLPLVLVGAALSIHRGAQQVKHLRAPTYLALTLQAAIAAAVVTAFLPLAWDRYYLSLQPVASLLAALALVAAYDALKPKPRPEAPAPS